MSAHFINGDFCNPGFGAARYVTKSERCYRFGQSELSSSRARTFDAIAAEKHVDVVKYSRLPTLDASYQAGFLRLIT